MTGRRCIFLMALLAVLFLAGTAAASPGMYSPDRFPEDSLARMTAERNRRLYDSLRLKSSRHAVPRLLYRWLVRPTADTTQNGRVADESRALAPYAGKTIGEIEIEREQVFDPDGNRLERLGNKLHALTRERVIRRDLLFRPGDKLDPQLIVRNKQLLRSRSYLSQVAIDVRPDPLDTSRVDLLIRTRDSWTITVDGDARSEGRTMAALVDANILGTGNLLRLKTHFSRKDLSYGGNMVEYEIPNLLGTFYTAECAAGRDFHNSTLDLQLRKEFLRPTDYEVGAAYSNLKFKQYMIEQDTSLRVRQRNLNLWGGYAHYLRPVASSLFLTGHYNYRRFLQRPEGVTATHHPALHGHDLLLFGAGLYREKFLTASLIYGFGADEYLATGYKAEITGGCSWGEFNDELYLGASYKTGGFRSIGYIMGGISAGSYLDRRSGAWRRNAVDVDLRWFSNLFLLRRSRMRQFLMLNYTQGWNRGTGNDERIRFTKHNGLQALEERAIGTNRLVLNTETVVFTPWQPFGFRLAIFGFADFGLIGYAPNIFENSFYTSLGGGLRIKNERLIFNTIQIRLGIAFGKNGLAASQYFRLSNATRLEQYRYRPERPEPVAFE